ncbi:MAG TPA: hypothetical protein DCP92_07450 [Nitrospiraceae bacterium]|nr:hypothetical protein [Nitrospiraceae bacterium]
MKRHFRAEQIVLILISITIAMVPILAYAGGYFVTDRDGNVISEKPEKVTIIGSSEKSIVFNDKRDRKVFEVQWDASSKRLVVKGDNVYVQIFSTGKIEKLTTINGDETNQMPITIEPVVPVSPRKNG